MSTTTEPSDTERLPGDPSNIAPNGGAPAVVADAIARRDADRAARAQHSDRRASRF